MDISMPVSFPTSQFRAFGLAASAFFPELASNESRFDSQEKWRYFDWSWQAVRYRYRSCAECNEEFKALLANPSEQWKAGWSDEELSYKLERCIYVFFMSGLSVFDSFAFCLYFLGHALQPSAFPDVGNPRGINRKATSEAFSSAFPEVELTKLIATLSDDARFSTIVRVRNIMGHRISGRRCVHSTASADATYVHWREDTWYLPGTFTKLTFDPELLRRHLDDITGLITSLASAAREFAENQQARKTSPSGLPGSRPLP